MLAQLCCWWIRRDKIIVDERCVICVGGAGEDMEHGNMIGIGGYWLMM